MYLKILKISQIIKQKTINFTELVKNSNSILSLNLQSKIVDNLNEIFSDQEQHWYIANLYMYMNYHQLDDFIVNLDNVWKFIGFSNKANAKRLLKHNFKEDIDYKISLIRTDERVHGGQKSRNNYVKYKYF